MTESSARAHDLALRLLRYEGASEGSHSGAIAAAAYRVLQRLQTSLSRWFGAEGFDALLSRALGRARAENDLLAGVSVSLNGEVASAHLLDGLFDGFESVDPPAALAATVAVIAAVIALLGRLVGDDMAARLLQQIWPDPAREEQQFTDEGTRE